MSATTPLSQFMNELTDPDMVGSSEYLAVYEVLENCEDIEEAVGVVEEFLDIAMAMLKKLKPYRT